MEVTKDTLLSDLCHSEELTHWLGKGEAASDHKYTKREWKNGRWQYWYDNSTSTNTAIKKPLSNIGSTVKTKQQNLKSNLNAKKETIKNDIKTNATNSFNKATDNAIAKANEASKHVNGLVDKGKEIINKLYDDPNNKYDIHSENYDKKMAQVKETKEWQDIVARSDPEYVKKNADGTVSYLIDDYVVDKKHPLLDMVGDVAAGRDVDINEITKESTIAGLKEHAFGYLRTGAMAAGIISTVLTEKFKLSQGTYDDDIERLTKTVADGADYTKSLLEDAKTITDEGVKVASQVKTAADSGAKLIENDYQVSPESIEKMAKAVREGQMAAEAARSVNEGNVVQAAKIVMESDMLQSVMGDNEYYKLMANTLENLSPEEAAALNLLMKQLRSK